MGTPIQTLTHPPQREPCRSRAPLGTTAVSYLWPPHERGPASLETFLYRAQRLLFFFSLLYTYGGSFPPRGPPLPALLLAPGEPLPRWRQAPPPLQRWMDRAACLIHSKTAQHGTAQHGHHPGNREITGNRDLAGRRGAGPLWSPLWSCDCVHHRHHLHHHTFSWQDRTGECAHRVAGVCACVCLPVWITMMQSAAVLPTESPVKGLPEILGVPMQRKPFLHSFCRVFQGGLAGKHNVRCRGLLKEKGLIKTRPRTRRGYQTSECSSANTAYWCASLLNL